jgi:hypothetical protein
VHKPGTENALEAERGKFTLCIFAVVCMKFLRNYTYFSSSYSTHHLLARAVAGTHVDRRWYHSVSLLALCRKGPVCWLA